MSFSIYAKDIIEFIAEVIALVKIRFDDYINKEENEAKIEYSMAGFRNFCYMREMQLVV